jgi:hypothetical protein
VVLNKDAVKWMKQRIHREFIPGYYRGRDGSGQRY